MTSYACITGATGVLGRTFASQCAEKGWNLLLTDRDEDALSRFSQELQSRFAVDVKFAACDLQVTEQRDVLYGWMQEEGLKVWMLINVAGLDHEGKFMDIPLCRLREVIRINIESTVETIHTCVRLRDGTRAFRLITVASLAGFYAMPYKATYAASKAFLIRLAHAVGEELKSAGGSSTVLCPAGLKTRPDAVAAIEAQGLWGKLTTVDTEKVVASTLQAALKGRPVVIPGGVNRILYVLGLCVPSAWKTKAIHGKWRRAHAKRGRVRSLKAGNSEHSFRTETIAAEISGSMLH